MKPDSKPSPMRWLMISLAFWATVINYLDRQTLSVAAPVLRDQFHMSNTDYSRVVFAFLLSYTVMNGVSGPLIDKLGTRVGYALCMAWWSGAALLHAFTSGAFSLGAFRFLLGAGEAGNWPGGVKVVAEWFPERERALASGIFNSGSAVGAILAPPIVVFIMAHFGWPMAFVAVGVAGFLWLLVWWPVYRSPGSSLSLQSSPDPAGKIFVGQVCNLRTGLQPVQESAARPENPINKSDPDSSPKRRNENPPQVANLPHIKTNTTPAIYTTRQLLRSRFVLAFTFSKIFFDPVWYFYIFWFPEYLKRARHFDMASIGAYSWIPFAVAGLGNFAGGLLSAFLLRRGYSVTVARKGSVTFFAALMLSAVPAVLASQAWVSIAFVSVAMFGYTAGLANMLSIPADVFPGHSVASVYGLASMGSGFGGMLFTLITGWVVDHYSYTPVFIGFGILPLIGALILWTLAGPLTPVPIHFLEALMENTNAMFQGKTVLVTGASSGIGLATALAFGARKAHVIVHYNHRAKEARDVVAQIEQSGGSGEILQGDLSTIAGVQAMAQAISGRQIDILVNNAGWLVKRARTLEFTPELWDQVMTLNLTSAFFLAQAVLPGMVARKSGVIINNSSIAARNGGGMGAGVYAAAKAGVNAITKNLAKEFASQGIRVNAVSPGTIDTDYHKNFSNAQMLDGVRAATPMGRLGKAEEVADLIVFLAGDGARFIQGQAIEVNGGHLMV